MLTFGMFSSTMRAEEAASVMQLVGFNTSDITLIKSPSEVKSVVYSEREMALSMKRGIYVGAVIGFCIGISMLIDTGSPALNRWWGVIAIPLAQAFGWALFGMIAGSGGLFARGKVSAEVEHQFEKAVAEGNAVLAIQLQEGKAPADVVASLLQAGATDVEFELAA